IPSNEENFRFFNAEKFARMKSDAVLINTARGEVVDEEAFLYALKTRKIAGAAIDVLNGDSVWEEDIPAGNPLVEYARKHNNLLITPHMGGYGRTSIENTRTFIVKKFIKHLENL
ncbi:MAG: hydroxyacid dehydrogenase, partial [Bacteroidetes bacterium]|nr:hydroxyacid dehydrogenase [Bacteroidota bacterium]